jgi:hypothetical protein
MRSRRMSLPLIHVFARSVLINGQVLYEDPSQSQKTPSPLRRFGGCDGSIAQFSYSGSGLKYSEKSHRIRIVNLYMLLMELHYCLVPEESEKNCLSQEVQVQTLQEPLQDCSPILQLPTLMYCCQARWEQSSRLVRLPQFPHRDSRFV